MKRIVVLFIAIMILIGDINVFADNSISTSYTYSKNTLQKYTVSQDAYIPSGIFNDLELQKANDLYILNDIMYVADTGNQRIISVDLLSGKTKIIGENILNEPMGVSADKDGNIYVADVGNQEAYVFDNKGQLIKTFTKPTAPSFGKKESFKPFKIAPTDDMGVYIVSEGNDAGIIHINSEGDFLGYFASNNINLNFAQRIMNIFLTDDQKEKFLKVRPSSYAQIFRGKDGLVYTANKGSGVRIKKHTISGMDMLTKKNDYMSINVEDIFIDDSGKMFLVEKDGFITVISSEGNVICDFGGDVGTEEVVGLFKSPSGISVDSEDNVYVLDSARNYIQKFTPSQNQRNIYTSIDLYNQGMYDESMELLKEISRFNNTLYIVHYYYGKNLLQKGMYEKAMEHFEICNEKELYSEAYWEVRNEWLQTNLGIIIFVLILLYGIFFVSSIFLKKSNAYKNFKNIYQKIFNVKLINDISKIKYALLHPIDSAYEIKAGRYGTIISAVIINIFIFIIFVLTERGSGFIYSTPIYRYSIVSSFLSFYIVFTLFIISNYYISALHDGNGSLKDIFITTNYSFAPIVLFMPVIIIISNFSTLNEAFIINGFMGILIFWSSINVILGLIEIHEYTFREMMKNLILTFVTMLIIVLALSIGYVLVKQFYSFIIELITEVALRV